MVEVQLTEEVLIGPALALWRRLSVSDRHILRLAFSIMLANPHQIGDYREGRMYLPHFGHCDTFHLRLGFVSFNILVVRQVVCVYEMSLSPEIDAPEYLNPSCA